MKQVIRIPCAEQYSYYELEVEVKDFVEAAEMFLLAMMSYKALKVKQDKEELEKKPF